MKNAVKQKFNSYPKHIKPKMESLRNLIYKVAKTTDGVGEIEETLKWGEPSYLTTKPKTGTTIRIDWKPKNPDQIGMYVNCQTTLISNLKTLFNNELEFEGNRAIVFPVNKPIPKKQLTVCIKMALRYHLDKDK
jgi:Domain of unknown function (DU1801)